jgi:hypothetical protein
VWIGQQYNAGQIFEGSIGEVLLYNLSITPSEVNTIYASEGAVCPCNGLVSRWSMENNGISTGNPHPNNSIIKDSVGVNDATVTDGADNSMILDSSPTRRKRGRR